MTNFIYEAGLLKQPGREPLAEKERGITLTGTQTHIQIVRKKKEKKGVPLRYRRGWDRDSRTVHKILKSEDYHYLLQDHGSLRTTGDFFCEARSFYNKLRGRPKGIKEFFPRSSVTEKVFSFPEFIEKQLMVVWAKPMVNRQFPSFIKKLYALPPFTIFFRFHSFALL